MKNDILFLNLNSDNHGQKSWNKFTFVAHFRTGQTNSQARIHLHMFSPFTPPPPPPPLHCWTRVHAICSEVQHCMGVGGGGKATHFETQKQCFFNSACIIVCYSFCFWLIRSVSFAVLWIIMFHCLVFLGPQVFSDPICCSFLTWFGHDFPVGQFVSVRSVTLSRL